MVVKRAATVDSRTGRGCGGSSTYKMSPGWSALKVEKPGIQVQCLLIRKSYSLKSNLSELADKSDLFRRFGRRLMILRFLNHIGWRKIMSGREMKLGGRTG